MRVRGWAREAAQQWLSLLATQPDRGADLWPESLGAAGGGLETDALGIRWCQK